MARPGPKPRYPRAEKAVAYRPHVRIEAVLKARAKEAGLSWSEYTEYVLGQAFGMPECAPEPTRDSDNGQEALLPDLLTE